MKKIIEMFPEFHQEKLKLTDIKDENNLIVVDTNFLLQILELPIDIATKYVDSLKSIKKNLYIPYLVALEFHFNKSNKKKSKKRNADSYFKQVESALNELRASVQSTDLIKIDIENSKLKHLIGNLELFTDDFLDKVNSFIRDEITDKEDGVYKELLNIISDSIGDMYEQKWVDEIEKEGEERFAEGIPPGFDDKNKDGLRKYNGISYHKKYGDLIIWKDILKKAKEQPHGDKVIFVTNDGESNKKSDLIYKTSNMKVGPSIFLMNELYICSRKKLYILNNTKLVNMITKLSEDEIDRIESQEEKKYVVTFPKWILDKAEKDIRVKNESNNSSLVFYIDSEDRLSSVDIDEIEPLQLISLLENPNVEKMLKEEIVKKLLDGYYSKLPKHIIKDIINSYQRNI
ncbi:PIN-like domain-containing protein [Streptococcus infantarius]|uniref:PIN-like domain-containing protein n=1 Tax=Streptococcus infantarius TaxID=102684 RepID=UPI003D140C1E